MDIWKCGYHSYIDHSEKVNQGTNGWRLKFWGKIIFKESVQELAPLEETETMQLDKLKGHQGSAVSLNKKKKIGRLKRKLFDVFGREEDNLDNI